VCGDKGRYMYRYVHQADFIASECAKGRYWVGRNVKKTDEFWCWGSSKKDAQDKITEEYDKHYPTHPKPIVIKRVLEWGIHGLSKSDMGEYYSFENGAAIGLLIGLITYFMYCYLT